MATLHLAQEIFNLIYPVGSIYLSWNSTDPSKLFGGTWERLSGGFLYGCVDSPGVSSIRGTATGSASGSTGSASGNTGSTILTVDQIPKHRHVGFYWSGHKISLNALTSGDYGLS